MEIPTAEKLADMDDEEIGAIKQSVLDRIEDAKRIQANRRIETFFRLLREAKAERRRAGLRLIDGRQTAVEEKRHDKPACRLRVASQAKR